MKKRVLPVVVGLVSGWIVVFALERLNHVIYPTPAGADPFTKEDIAAIMAEIPIGAFVLLFLSWMISATVAGSVASVMSRPNWRNNVIIVGVVLSIGALVNMMMIPHPTWLIIASGIGYVPCAYFGGRLFKNKTV